jgi:hypothetical protein
MNKMEKIEIDGRIKIVYIPFLRILSVKDKQKQFKFKSSFWSDGNITMRYKKVNSMYWHDLGFRGNVYNMDQLQAEIKDILEK